MDDPTMLHAEIDPVDQLNGAGHDDPAPAQSAPPKPPYRFAGTLPPALDPLRERRQWVAWDYTWNPKKGKWDKPPRSAHTGRLASINDAAALGTFDEAAATAQRLGLAGVGFALRPDDGITGGDLDHCVADSGSFSLLAAHVVEAGETYAEYSPSGEGLRFLARGKIEHAVKADQLGVEIYGSGRYLTITGRQVEGTPDAIQPAPRTIAMLQEAVAAARGERPRRDTSGTAKPHGPDFFANVNAASLANLDAWVPRLHPTAIKQPGTGAWRVRSASLGRDREEDISYHANGIQDFGDEHGMTPIDAVLRFGTAAEPVDAAMWLCQQIGVEPASLGWRAKDASNSREGEEEAQPSQMQPIKPLPLADFLKLKIPQREWVIEPLIRERFTAMIYSWRGVGKSRFAHSLGFAIATGGKFLKWDAKGRKRGVLVVDGELTAPELQERLASIAGDTPPDNFHVLAADIHELGLPNLATPKGQKVIEDALGDLEVLILDNLSTLFQAGAENEAESWQPMQRWLLRLRRKGKTVIVIHHAGKGGDQRGTSRREDVLDLVLNLRRPDDYDPEQGACFDVRFDKARSLAGADQATFRAGLAEDATGATAWYWESVEKSRNEEIRDLAAEGKSVRQIAKELGISKSAVQRALSGAGSAKTPNCPAVPPPRERDSGTPTQKRGSKRPAAAGQQSPNPYAVAKNGMGRRDSNRDRGGTGGVPQDTE